MDRPPGLDPGDALFLDLDGTLAPIEARPDDVVFDGRRAELLARLEQLMGGALAVISGRGLGDIDRILGGAPACVSAVHGLVRRSLAGGLVRAEPSPKLREVRLELKALVRDWPGLLLEDKELSVALHYRAAPEAEKAVKAAAARLASDTGLKLQDGIMVCELRTPGGGKGEALNAFMRERPFAGRRPVMVGDDLTDEDAFEAAASAGGFGVLVGPVRSTAARYRLESVEAALAWLAEALSNRKMGESAA
jgi:trehalose 6-phosphate phosphatase